MTDVDVARFRAAVDELEIRNLVGRYCHHTTTADTSGWAATWAPDAVWEIPGDGRIEGRESIAATYERIRALYTMCVQQVLSGEVSVDGETATARWYVREQQWRDGPEGEPVGSELVGTYDDELARCEGAWLFSKRTFSIIYAGRVPLTGSLHVRRP